MKNVTVAATERLEDLHFDKLLVICNREVPTKRVDQVDVLGGVAFERFVLQDLHDLPQDGEELLLDSFLSDVAAAFRSSQVVCLLHQVVAKGALQPLDQVEDASLVVAEVHREVEQVQTG